MLPIGESVHRKSFGLSLCSGVSTTPGAMVLKRMPSFAYWGLRLVRTGSRQSSRINGAYEKPKSVADIHFSCLREGGETSALPVMLACLAISSELQDGSWYFTCVFCF